MKTPQLPSPDLATALGVPELYLKREDMHPFGSHKGRSIPHMIETYRLHGKKDFTISSSGNAALAALVYIQTHNRNNPDDLLSLRIFVGNKIHSEKFKTLTTLCSDPRITIEQVDTPKQQAFTLQKNGEAIFLRQSTDAFALEGYVELAAELNHIPNLHAIFVPTSSGTTAQALGQAFEKLSQHPQIHIVQTTACHPIADSFEKSETLSSSLASAIVDHIAHRKQAVVHVIQKSKGHGWIITDDEIHEAIHLVEKTVGMRISPNSALSIAGLKKAKEAGWSWDGAVVCLITGA